MKRIASLVFLMISVSLITFAKKDTNAWKKENNLNHQYLVFKKNLNYWNGSYFLKELQLDEFYGAMKDSIAVFEKFVVNNKTQIISLEKELDTRNGQLNDMKQKLDESIKLQNALSLMGIKLHKNVYTLMMSLLILGLMVLLSLVFLMYKGSNKVAVSIKNEYHELKAEFEEHKKSSLERYTKINTELHKTRLELNKR